MGKNGSFVSTPVAGLGANTTYYYELTVQNNATTAKSVTLSGSFKTLATSSALQPDGENDTSATIQAAIDAAGKNGTVVLDGGVFMLDGGAKIEDVTVEGGKEAGFWPCGGGLLVNSGTVSRCRVRHNQLNANNGYGAGVYIFNGQIDHSIVAFNRTTGGTSGAGGIGCNNATTAGTILVDTCLVYGNAVPSGKGGGICFDQGNPNVTLRNTTITDNSASAAGGGLCFSTSKMKLVNSIVSGNSFGEGEGEVFGIPESASGNLVGEDPLFEDAANGDYHLRADSPAVSIGAWYEGISEDLDGKRRFRRVDAGCYKIDRGMMIMIK